MALLSSTAALPLVSAPSIAADSACSRPDLQARFAGVYSRWKLQRERDQRASAAADQAELEGQEFELPDSEATWSAINEEAALLADEIAAMQVISLADLALQARACALENSEDWTDWHSDVRARGYRRLVDNIMAMVGSEALPGVSTAPV